MKRSIMKAVREGMKVEGVKKEEMAVEEQEDEKD